MTRRHPALPPEIVERISHEEVSNLPVCRYEGPVHLVADPAEIHRAMHDIRKADVIVFDTETRPAFKRGESYLPGPRAPAAPGAGQARGRARALPPAGPAAGARAVTPSGPERRS